MLELLLSLAKEHAEERVYDNEVEASDPERNLCISCEKCDFVAKSETGLKTHDTVKHKNQCLEHILKYQSRRRKWNRWK